MSAYFEDPQDYLCSGISPTYLSSGQFTPNQPARCTIPRYNCMIQQPVEGGRRTQRKKEILPTRPENHQPTLWASSAMAIHPSMQSRREGSLIYSNLRLNDEFIPAPKKCLGYAGLMREECKLVQTKTHLSRLEMFPRGRSEYQGPKLPHEIRQTVPLSKATYNALLDTAGRRYCQTSYMKDFPATSKEFQPIPNLESNKHACGDKCPNRFSQDAAIQGKWPEWPGSDAKIVDKRNGRIVEKRGKVSVDDAGDLRLLKLFPEKPRKVSDELKNFHNVPLAMRRDIYPVNNFYVCGVGPYKTGVTNETKHLMTSRFPSKSAIAAAAKEAVRSKMLHSNLQEKDSQDLAIYRVRRTNSDCNSQNCNEKKTDCSLPRQNILNSQEHLDKEANHKAMSLPNIDCANAETVEESKRSMDEKSSEEPSLWSLEFKRREEKFDTILESVVQLRKQNQSKFDQLKKQRVNAATRQENLAKDKEKFMVTGDPTSSFYSPEIKLPPTELWNSLENTDKETRLRLPYKSIAGKRFRLKYLDPVANLDDLRRKQRKDKFNGYPSSVFR